MVLDSNISITGKQKYFLAERRLARGELITHGLAVQTPKPISSSEGITRTVAHSIRDRAAASNMASYLQQSDEPLSATREFPE